MNKILSPLLLAVALVGCTMMPKYEQPAAPVAVDWPLRHTDTNAAVAADLGWRDVFRDARLQQLIGLALADNRDIRVAVLKVEQARAQYRIERSALLPTLDATGSGTRQRTPGDLTGTGKAQISSQYGLGVGVTGYELDLFGRVRSLKAEALETYLATAEARKSVQIALVAEVADHYLAECELTELLAVSRGTLDAAQANYRLLKGSYDIGNTSELDLRTAEAQMQSARAAVALYERQRMQAGNALVLLVGQPLPADLPAAQPLATQGLIAGLAPGLPSELLQRRPDILQAEHQLKAANADIGAARAAFFPRITLTGSAGTASSQLSDLFAPGSDAWSFAPQISVPLFDAGNNAASLDVAKLRKQIEVAQYEGAIQTAFREVADALVARATYDEQLAAHEALEEAQQQRFQLAQARYREGVDSYLAVLTAQQDLFSAQQSVVQSRYARWSNRVTLYKTLGGGWNEHTQETPAQQSQASVQEHRDIQPVGNVAHD